MRIKKMGTVLEFMCASCNSVFVAGINSVSSMDGNYYCICPVCGAECHTDVSKQPPKEVTPNDWRRARQDDEI